MKRLTYQAYQAIWHPQERNTGISENEKPYEKKAKNIGISGSNSVVENAALKGRTEHESGWAIPQAAAGPKIWRRNGGGGIGGWALANDYLAAAGGRNRSEAGEKISINGEKPVQWREKRKRNNVV